MVSRCSALRAIILHPFRAFGFRGLGLSGVYIGAQRFRGSRVWGLKFEGCSLGGGGSRFTIFFLTSSRCLYDDLFTLSFKVHIIYIYVYVCVCTYTYE